MPGRKRSCECGNCLRCTKTLRQKEARKAVEKSARAHGLCVISGESFKLLQLRIDRKLQDSAAKANEARIDGFHAWP